MIIMKSGEEVVEAAPDRSVDRSVSRPAISVRGIARSFGGQQVLSHIDFDIAPGELLVVLGLSGSGKTTLLRIISGLDHPDAGEVNINGERVNELPAQKRGLGVVFQEQALFRHMTVEQNIAFGLKVRGVSGAESRKIVGEMLDLIRLQDHRAKYPSQLSGGQRQRVAVARALAYRPQAVLFDEPFSALDAVTRAELRREVRLLLRSMNVSALFITHDQEEALELADRIAILNNGKIEQLDTPFMVYNRPRNEFVATFLGAANVLLGRWQGGKVAIGRLRLAAPPGAPPLFERQQCKIVFRPEDIVINFQPQLLGTPFYLGRAVVEDIFYIGPSERLSARLTFRFTQNDPGETEPRPAALSLVDETYSEGLSITVTRSKWDATEMELAPGDPIVLGLKDYRLLPHYPLGTEQGARVE
ncbi:MAG TPA: ABC transporter ATP-binding protein [Blastocatellia bacterium]|nr:ABC transporter ATP-binding protein [Blastocatellia bacterium]